jgi:hypothetical protein
VARFVQRHEVEVFMPIPRRLRAIPAALALLAAVACDTPAPTAPNTTTPVGGTISTLIGVVINAETHQPVDGAVVNVNVLGVVKTTVTAGGGTYRIESLPEGRAALTIRADRFEPRMQEVMLAGPEVRIENALIPLPTGGPPPTVEMTTVTGVITNRNTNQPLNNATVTLRLENGLAWYTTTDTFGRFMLTGVPVGAAAELRASANNYIPEDRRMPVDPNMYVLLSLSPL